MIVLAQIVKCVDDERVLSASRSMVFAFRVRLIRSLFERSHVDEVVVRLDLELGHEEAVCQDEGFDAQQIRYILVFARAAGEVLPEGVGGCLRGMVRV